MKIWAGSRPVPPQPEKLLAAAFTKLQISPLEHGEVELGTIYQPHHKCMQNLKMFWLKLLIAVVFVTAIHSINIRFAFLGYYAGWFAALGFPIILGEVGFGIAFYFSTQGKTWKRLLISLCGGSLVTFLWLAAFMFALIRIMGWGELLIKQP